MSDLTVVQGDNMPNVIGTITDADTGDPIDLSTASAVVFQMRKPNDRRFTVNAAATVTDGPNGRVRYSWGANDLSNIGDFQAQWRVTYADATKQTTQPPNTITVRRA